MTWDDPEDPAFDDPATDEEGGDRAEAKRDRLARLLSVLGVLQASGEAGIRPEEIARRTGMSKRTVYRDLRALESELRLPVWSEGGRWGVQPGAFLPPLRPAGPDEIYKIGYGVQLANLVVIALALYLASRPAKHGQPFLAAAALTLVAALLSAVFTLPVSLVSVGVAVVTYAELRNHENPAVGSPALAAQMEG